MGKLAIVLVVLGLAASASADLLVGYDVNGLLGSEGRATSTVVAANILTPIYLTRGAGLTAPGGADSFNSSAWTVGGTADTGLAGNDFLEWTISAADTFSFSVTNFSFRWTRSGTGPTNLTLRSSVDNYVSDLAAFTKTDTAAQDIQQTLNLAASTGTTFRLIGYQAGGSSGTTRMDNGASFGQAGIDFATFGEVIPEPGTLALIILGIGALGVRRFFKR